MRSRFGRSIRRPAAALAAAVVGLGFAPAALAASLVHAYDFNGSAVVDSVGGANGTLVNGATVSGGVLHLDGIDDYVQFSDYLVPANTAGNVNAYSVYVRVQGVPAVDRYTEIISQGVSGSSGFYIGTEAPGEFRLGDTFGGIGIDYPSGPEFHDLLLTVGDGTGTRFYLDGTQVFSSATEVRVLTESNFFTRFGQQYDLPGGGQYNEFFHGQLDTVRIFSGVATLADLNPTPGIPEPQAWALMILGFGGVGAMARRRPSPAQTRKVSQ
jgi:hypothetical protein